MEVAQAIRSRRSIRRYTAQPLPAEVLERLLEAAHWAPSAHNRQPWRWAVVQTPQVKQQLAEAMGARLRADRLADGDAPAVIDADVARSQARLNGAPALLVLSLTLADMDHYPDRRRKKAEFLMAVQSTALAAQNLLLAAQAEGLGVGWSCAPLFCPEVVRAALALPADWEPQAVFTLGHPAEAGKPAVRRPVRELTVWR